MRKVREVLRSKYVCGASERGEAWPKFHNQALLRTETAPESEKQPGDTYCEKAAVLRVAAKTMFDFMVRYEVLIAADGLAACPIRSRSAVISASLIFLNGPPSRHTANQ